MSTVISSDIIQAASGIEPVSGEDLLILPGVNVVSTGGNGIMADNGNNEIFVHGLVNGAISGIRIENAEGDFAGSDLTISATGVVSGFSNGIYTRDSSVTITNHGSIEGDTRGIDASDQGPGLHLLNTGTITAFSGHAVEFGSDGGVIINYGTITAVGNGASAIDMFVQDAGLGTAPRLVNYGHISTTGTLAISGDSSDANDMRNFGTITGSVETGNEGDLFLNGGTISGNLELQSGNDTYRALNDGLVTGNVTGSGGDDTLVGANSNDDLRGGADNDYVRGGAGIDTLDGGTGNDSMLGDAGDDVMTGDSGLDTMRGGSGDDAMDGGLDNDLMFGNNGHDTLLGDAGNDVLWGGQGEDSLEGGVGNDTLNGGSGRDELLGGDDNDMLRGGGEADAIYGETGDDVLQGGAGDDTLAGGLGRDVLNGGSGADDFRFTATNQSAVGALRDTIQDFEVGIDTLDLGAIPGVLSFVGTGPLTGAGPEVRAAVIGGGAHTLIQIDADGNGTVDSEILLTFTTGLTAGDFIL